MKDLSTNKGFISKIFFIFLFGFNSPFFMHILWEHLGNIKQVVKLLFQMKTIETQAWLNKYLHSNLPLPRKQTPSFPTTFKQFATTRDNCLQQILCIHHLQHFMCICVCILRIGSEGVVGGCGGGRTWRGWRLGRESLKLLAPKPFSFVTMDYVHANAIVEFLVPFER